MEGGRMNSQVMIRQIVADALRSPSGDNAQPWKFEWDGDELKIYHLNQKAKHSLNRKNHASYISFGTLLETIHISATTYGYRVTERLIFEESSDMALWAKLHFRQSGLQKDPLSDVISLRTTDRRVYDQGPMPKDVENQVLQIQKQFRNCEIHIQKDQTQTFTDYFLKCEEFLWKNVQVVSDIGKWLRLTKKEMAAKDGMPWRSLAISRMEALFFRLVRRFPSLPKLIWALGFGQSVRAKEKKTLQSSAALLCFTAKSVDPESLCEVGRVAYRTWLFLNSQGFGVQPLSYCSTSVADLISDAMDPNISLDEWNLFARGKSVIQSHFSLNPDEIPIWIFRTGLAPLDHLADLHTPRNSLKNVLEIKLPTLKRKGSPHAKQDVIGNIKTLDAITAKKAAAEFKSSNADDSKTLR